MISTKIRQNESGGALLVNVLVSVGILALLTTLSLPYMKKYQTGLKLSSAAKSLATDLRLTQQLTITEQAPYLLQFDVADQRYSILKIDGATTTIKTMTFPAEVTYESVSAGLDNKVSFNFFGGVSQSGSVTLKNVDGRQSIINIKPSGYVELAQ